MTNKEGSQDPYDQRSKANVTENEIVLLNHNLSNDHMPRVRREKIGMSYQNIQTEIDRREDTEEFPEMSQIMFTE